MDTAHIQAKLADCMVTSQVLWLVPIIIEFVDANTARCLFIGDSCHFTESS